jgi:hypothetical protein
MHDAIRAALNATGGLLPDRVVTAMANAVAQVAERRQADVVAAVGRLLDGAPPEDPGLEALERAHRATLKAAGLTEKDAVARPMQRSMRDAYLWSRYRITEAQYNWLLARQGHHCALCPATRCRADTDVLAVDHDHMHEACRGREACGRCVRGLVCARCNSWLQAAWPSTGQEHYLGGYGGIQRFRAKVAKDEPRWLVAAERYMRRGYIKWPAELLAARPATAPPAKPQRPARPRSGRLQIVK